jgi:hypothetical protein
MPGCKDLHNLTLNCLKKIDPTSKSFFYNSFLMFNTFVKHMNKRDSAQQKSKKITFLLLELSQTYSCPAS